MPKLFKFSSIFQKIVFSLALVTAFFVMLVVGASIRSIQPEIIKLGLNLSREIVDTSSNALTLDLDREAQNIEIYASDITMQEFAGKEGSEELKKEVEKHLILIMEERKIYDQLRYIDDEGFEKIRVDFENGEAVVTPQNKLQDKSDRYYFKESIGLDKNEVYVSDIDLNREGVNQDIEIPYKPVIRFASPVFDLNGEKHGILISNVLAENIIGPYKNKESAQIILVDNKGYYLLGEEENKLWGGPNDLDTGYNISKDFPDNYGDVLSGQTGSFDYGEKVVSFSPIRISRQKGIYWVVLRSVDKDVLFGVILNALIRNMVVVGVTYFVCFTAILYLLIRSITQPLVELTKVVSDLSTKNLGTPINIKTNDEIGRLARTFEKMSLLLKDVYSNLEEKVRQRTADLHKFKLAVENASDFITITDNKGIIIYANKAVEKVTGFSVSEAVGKKAGSKELWGGLMDAVFYKKLWKTISEDKKVFTGTLTNKRKDGTQYIALSSIYPILDTASNIAFYVEIERDITREKELERMKDEFVSIASHELRTPMTAIKGFVSMILEGDYGEVQKNLFEPLQSIGISTDRLIHLVNDLLNLSRIEAGRLRITLEQADPSKIVKETVDSMLSLAKEKNLKLQSDIKGTSMVQVDMDKLRQIITNLVGNSLKFTDKGSIVVTQVVEGDFVKISVADTGIGIPEKGKERVFGKFEQIHDNTKGRPQGTGLGLYITKMLVEKMGGKMWLESSKEGKGSVFSFTLPKSESKIAQDIKIKIDTEAKKHPDQKDLDVTKEVIVE